MFSLIMLLLVSWSTQAQGDVNFVADPLAPTSDVGVNFTVTITLESASNQQINSAALRLNFDPTYLQVVSANEAPTGNPLTSFSIGPNFDNSLGTIDYTASIFNTTVDANNIRLIDIVFEPIQNGSTALSFDLSNGNTAAVEPPAIDVTGTTNNIDLVIGSTGQPPVPDFTISPNPAETNQVVTLDASGSTDDGTIVDYSWDFGDGSPAGSGMNTTKSYTLANTYDITLTVMDNDNETAFITKQIVVNTPTVTQYTITTNAGPGGSITPVNATVNEGDNQLFNITPDPGFEITEILVDGAPVTIAPTYEFMNVMANGSISASFALIPPFQVCIASGSADLTAFGRNFIGDPNTAPPTVPEFTRTNGTVFAGYSGAIAGTTGGSGEELLFQKEIYGGAGGGNPNFTYNIPVVNGFYEIDLYFAEVFHGGANGRVFDVIMEGNVILDEYDLVNPIKDGLGSNQTAITRTYIVEVTDGELNVQIGPASTDNGKLSGICVTETSNTNVHPVTAIGDLTFTALDLVAETLNITDSDQLSITFNGLPGSLSYDPPTNQIQGTPLVADVGSFTINAIISDGTSAPVTEEFTLTIEAPAGNDPPIIAAINDIEVALGGTANTGITITDDNNVFNTTFVLYDKSDGGTNNPITPSTIIPDTEYTFTDNGSGSYSFSWNTAGPPARPGRSYLARVVTDDGVNPPVEELFSINVAQNLTGGIILARTIANPLPWFGGGPQAPFTVAIEATPAQNIGWIDPGEFVEYLVDVPAPGNYDVEFFAGKGNTGTLTVTLSEENGGGFSPIGSFGATQTGWQTYVSYQFQVAFANAGIQTLRLDFSGAGGVNIRDFNFTPAADTAPTIDPIADVEVMENETFTVNIQVNDDLNPNASIVIYDKSINTTPANTNTDPFTSGGTIAGFTFAEANPGMGDYELSFASGIPDGRSYFARVTADDGVNPVVHSEFIIDVAHPVPGIVDATTFADPLPWYGNSPQPPFTISIENSGTNIGYVDNGEFTEYLINVPTAGSYDIRFFSANGSGANGSSTTISILEEGNPTPVGSVDVPKTSWGNYQNYTTTINLASSGVQTLRLEFDGGVNTQEFELIDPNANTPPVVTITSPANNFGVESGVSINFTATANDPEDGDVSSSLVWNSNINGDFGNGPNVNYSALSIGDHVITATATDMDAAPLSGSATINLSVYPPAPDCDVAFRVNAGGPLYNSSTGDFEEDQSASNVGGTAQTGTPSSYLNLTPPAFDKTFGSPGPLVSNTTGYPDYLFLTERYSDAANPDNMNWEFPTGNGTFDVDILFNENWNGEINDPRVFDVEIEGVQVLTNYRPSVDGTEVNIAKVESFQTTVSDGVLNINFIKGTQNPAVKGFSICTVTPNVPPVVNITAPLEGANVTRGADVSLMATANDDEDGNIADDINWSSGDIQFSTNPISGVGGSITGQFVTPGPQTLTANVTDSDGDPGSDQITVNVSAPSVTITSPTEAQILNSTSLQLTWTSVDVLFGLTEHFHIYVNPPDPNNIDVNTRISTASAPGQQFWDLTSAEGLVEGDNTIVIRIANQFHEEFTNPEAEYLVNFVIDVPDTEDPSITCPADDLVAVDANCEAILADYTALATVSDNEDPNPTVTQSPTAGTTITADTIVTLTATDASGNQSSCTFQVNIDDTIAPNAVCQDITIQLDATGSASITAADIDGGSTDNCDPNPGLSVDIDTFSGADIGANTVTLTVTDASGNSSTCTATVTVEDNLPPVALCQPYTLELDAAGNGIITPGDVDGGSSDNVGIAEYLG